MATKTPEKEGFIDVTGGKVWYKIVGEKKGTPLIVLHGGPGYPHDYLEPLEDLAEDRQVIFYDQLGCGNSERPEDKKLWTIERFVEELEQVITNLGLTHYNLIGHSWGATLSICYALTNPTGLKSIILADPYLSTPIWENDAKMLIKTLPQETQMSLNKHNLPGFTKTEEFQKASDVYYKHFVYGMESLPAAVKKANKKFSSIIYNQMWGPKEFAPTGTLIELDLTPELKKITFPVLIICGRYDEATPEAGEYFKKLIPKSQLKILENSAHFSHWTDRKEYMSTVKAFLKELD
ncbi:MAG TPA: proline iminopeptidase-family hydrolase [Candidatus Limnocylindrales bacterium]|nr:proline iminopeptidase-family hydrolase [Candidatus Limnocylindrales bacterium]